MPMLAPVGNNPTAVVATPEGGPHQGGQGYAAVHALPLLRRCFAHGKRPAC